MKKIFLAITVLALSFSGNAKAQSTDGDNIFDVPGIHDIYITFPYSTWYDTLVFYKPLDTMVMCTVDFDGTLIDSVGIQFKGNSSYNAPGVKKPIKLGFDEFVNQKYDGLKGVNLNNAMKDPTLMREKLAYDLCQRNNIPASRCTYARIFFNGTYWGLYNLVELVNKTFLSDRYGTNNNDGNLFKGDPNGTLQWYGSSPSLYYNKYELKTNETTNDWTDLVHLIDKINNTPSADFYDSLETVMDTWHFIALWAVDNMFVNLDSYIGSGHNYYTYHSENTNKFEFITWDMNETFGNFNMGMTITQLENLSAFFVSSPSTNRPLVNKMLADPAYKQMYISMLCGLLQNDFTTSNLYPRIDSIANAIRPDVYADMNKPYSNSDFENNITNNVMGNIPGLKSFIANRRTALTNELLSFGCWLSTSETDGFQANIIAYPNPFSEQTALTFNVPANTENVSLQLTDVLGRSVTEEISYSETPPLNGTATINLQRNNLSSGVYMYTLKADGKLFASGRIIAQ